MNVWEFRALRNMDLRVIPILLALMFVSLLVIAATSGNHELAEASWLTPLARSQLQWFFLGILCYLFFAALDYRALRSWSPVLYGLLILSLAGLFFTPAVHNVHRWYRIGALGTFQPSEYAKWIVVVALSAFLEREGRRLEAFSTLTGAGLLVGIPFLLILKQPDLGTALILYPIALVMFYFGGLPRVWIRIMAALGLTALAFVVLMFLGFLSHEELRPQATRVLREYQYERLNPNNYHAQAAQIAVALGGVTGTGWRQSEFTGHQWLPEASTDSVFPAFVEEFGCVGAAALLGLFAGLIYCCFQVTAVARDRLGRLLSAGIGVYIAMHVIVNVGMMVGLLPITGVPLVLVTSGGSSVLSTMMALGIVQSIYIRRYQYGS